MNSQSQEAILLTKIIEQNNVIIALIGKLAVTRSEVLKIVVSGKQKAKQQKYVEGYNACDGDHSLSEIAGIIGVDPSTLSPILQNWGESGIIYPVTNPKVGKFYKKIFPI